MLLYPVIPIYLSYKLVGLNPLYHFVLIYGEHKLKQSVMARVTVYRKLIYSMGYHNNKKMMFFRAFNNLCRLQ